MLRSIVLLCAGVLCASGARADCEAAPLVRWVSTPPLLGGAAETRSTVLVHADGCVLVTLPRQMRTAGKYRLQLDPVWLSEVRILAAAPELMSFDARAKTEQLGRGPMPAGASVHAVLDEDIVSLQIYAGRPSPRAQLAVQWPSIRADRLNHPADEELAAFDALHLRLAPLLSTAASRGERLP